MMAEMIKMTTRTPAKTKRRPATDTWTVRERRCGTCVWFWRTTERTADPNGGVVPSTGDCLVAAPVIVPGIDPGTRPQTIETLTCLHWQDGRPGRCMAGKTERLDVTDSPAEDVLRERGRAVAARMLDRRQGDRHRAVADAADAVSRYEKNAAAGGFPGQRADAHRELPLARAALAELERMGVS